MVGDLGLGFLLNLWEFVFGIVDDETAATPREGKTARASELGQGGEMGRSIGLGKTIYFRALNHYL